MSDEDAGQDELEIAVQQQLAASGLGPLNQTVEGVAQILQDHRAIEKLTMFRTRSEQVLYAKMGFNSKLVAAVEEQDEKGFVFPDFDDSLIQNDYKLRMSIGRRKPNASILESITKIFERGSQGGRGWFGFGRR
jgi:hypothetical protein